MSTEYGRQFSAEVCGSNRERTVFHVCARANNEHNYNNHNDNNNNDTNIINISIDISNDHSMYLRARDAEEEWGIAVEHIIAWLSKAPKGNGIGATGSKNWVWF